MRLPMVTFCVFLLSSIAMADDKVEILAIENMTCPLCGTIVGNAVKNVAGVLAIIIDRKTHTAQVTYDDTITSPEDIITAARNAGYPAHRIKRQ